MSRHPATTSNNSNLGTASYAELADLLPKFQVHKGTELYLFAAGATYKQQFRWNKAPSWTGADFLADSGPLGLAQGFETDHLPLVWDSRLFASPNESDIFYQRLVLYGRVAESAILFCTLARQAYDAFLDSRGQCHPTVGNLTPEAMATGWMRLLADPEMQAKPAMLGRVRRLAWPRATEELDRLMGVWRGLICTDVFTLSARFIDRLVPKQSDPEVNTASTNARRNRGRPHLTPAEISTYKRILRNWDAAKNTGQNRRDFCQAHGIGMSTLSKVQAWHRAKKRREQGRQGW